jgi:hypothetical protein
MNGWSEEAAVSVVELLGLGAGVVTDPRRGTRIPAVLLTVRPDPVSSWASSSFALNLQQAKRLRDDLTRLLQVSQPSAPASWDFNVAASFWRRRATMNERNTTTTRPPRPHDIANKCELIRANWSREESRARRRLAALKQQQLVRRVLRESDCRNAIWTVVDFLRRFWQV